MRGFLLWTRVAWWALLVGVIELVVWLSGSRHGRAIATAAALAALGGGVALFHPAPASTTRPPTQVINLTTRPLPPPALPACVPHLMPTLTLVREYDRAAIGGNGWTEQGTPPPSIRPLAPILPVAICPVRVIPIPLAQAGMRTSDLVYHPASGEPTCTGCAAWTSEPIYHPAPRVPALSAPARP